METLLTIVVPLALVVVLVVGTVHVASRRRRPGRLSGAAGNALTDINALLQPERPTAEQVQKMADEDEDDHTGDGEPSAEALALGAGDHPDDRLRRRR